MRGCRTGDKSYIDLKQADQVRSVCGGGTFLPRHRPVNQKKDFELKVEKKPKNKVLLLKLVPVL